MTLTKHKDPNNTKNGTPWFWVELTFEWCECAMTFCVFIFIFLFRGNEKKNTWTRTILVPVMVIIYKCYSEIYLIVAVFKVLNNYKVYWQQHLKDILQLKTLRTWINISINSFLDKYDEPKMDEVAMEIISCTEIPACSLKNNTPRYFTYCCILLSETNLVFNFNLVSIEWFSPKLVYLFTFWYSVYLGVHPVPLIIFYKNQ